MTDHTHSEVEYSSYKVTGGILGNLLCNEIGEEFWHAVKCSVSRTLYHEVGPTSAAVLRVGLQCSEVGSLCQAWGSRASGVSHKSLQ